MSLGITMQPGVEDMVLEPAVRLSCPHRGCASARFLDHAIDLDKPTGPSIGLTPWHRDHKGIRLSLRVEMFHDTKNPTRRARASPPPPGWTIDLGPFIYCRSINLDWAVE